MNKLLISLLLALTTFTAIARNQLDSYSWNGMINGKWPVTVYVETMNGLVQGQIVYTNSKAGTPIKLLGNINNNVFDIWENDSNGEKTGYILGKITQDGGFSGTWKAPDKMVETSGYKYEHKEGKQYSIVLSKCNKPSPSPSPSPAPSISWAINLDDCYGSYSYIYGMNLACGDLKLTKIDGKVFCEITSVTSAPSFHTARVEKHECVLLSDRLLCTLSHKETYSDGECQFEIIPYRDFAVVNFIEGRNSCGFGMNASIDGIFLKTAGQSSITQYAWKGHLKETIPVEVLLEVRSDNLIGGEMRYTRTGSGKPIRILGQLGMGGMEEYSNTVFLDEYQPDGFQSGHIDFNFSNREKCEGNWNDDKNFFTLSLDKQIDFPSGKGGFFEQAEENEITGTYRYYYARPAGGEREACIKITKDDSGIRFNFFSNVSGITEYSNESDRIGAKLNNGKIRYTVKGCNYQFDITFFKGFLNITDINRDSNACDEAELKSSFEGYYIKQ